MCTCSIKDNIKTLPCEVHGETVGKIRNTASGADSVGIVDYAVFFVVLIDRSTGLLVNAFNFVEPEILERIACLEICDCLSSVDSVTCHAADLGSFENLVVESSEVAADAV